MINVILAANENDLVGNHSRSFSAHLLNFAETSEEGDQVVEEKSSEMSIARH